MFTQTAKIVTPGRARMILTVFFCEVLLIFGVKSNDKASAGRWVVSLRLLALYFVILVPRNIRQIEGAQSFKIEHNSTRVSDMIPQVKLLLMPFGSVMLPKVAGLAA